MVRVQQQQVGVQEEQDEEQRPVVDRALLLAPLDLLASAGLPSRRPLG